MTPKPPTLDLRVAWLNSDAGIAWEIDKLWREYRPGDAVKRVAEVKAAADAAGYARGLEDGRVGR